MSQSGGDGGLMALTARIGYDFTDLSLLELALTHRSLGGDHSERLEFLGDAVLGIVISTALYKQFPDWPEGKLSRMRASLVDRAALLQTAKLWRLAPSLQVSKGERTARGLPRSESIVADAVEAVIGAIYLDGEFSTASQVVLSAWQQRLLVVGEQQVVDAKSRLQEWTQERGLGTPDYLCDDLGVQKSPRFHVRCQVYEKLTSQGFGNRKKDAEQSAAQAALLQLQENL